MLDYGDTVRPAVRVEVNSGSTPGCSALGFLRKSMKTGVDCVQMSSERECGGIEAALVRNPCVEVGDQSLIDALEPPIKGRAGEPPHSDPPVPGGYRGS